MSVIQKILLTMLAVGVAGSVVGAGTFATFNAVVTNSGNTFATGFISFKSVGTNGTCESLTGGTASGTGCTTAFATLSSMKPGDTKYGHIVLTNETGSLTVTPSLTISDTTPTALTTAANGIGGAGSSSAGTATQTAPNLGVLIFQCTATTGGADTDCAGTTAKTLIPVYGTCASNPATTAAAIATTDIVPGATNNNVTVRSVSCVGGNTATAAYPLTVSDLLPSSGTLAANGTDSLAVIVYLPTPASSSTLQNLTATLSFAFTATQQAGTSS